MATNTLGEGEAQYPGVWPLWCLQALTGFKPRVTQMALVNTIGHKTKDMNMVKRLEGKKRG